MTTENDEFSAARFDQMTGQDRDYFHRQTGRQEMADAVSLMTRVFSLKALAEIKESKGYRYQKGRPVKPGSDQTLQGTWAEYCLYIVGRSVDQVDRDLANYQAFGEEALAAMQRAGIGYRQLRDLRRLPEDERAALIAAADGGDQDALIETAEDLLSRKGRQLSALTADLDEAKKTLEVKERLLAERNDELNRVRERLIMVQTDKTEREEALKLEVDGLVAEALRSLNVRLTEGFKVLTETAGETGDRPDLKRFMAAQIKDIRAAVAEIQEQFGIPNTPEEVNDPVWARKDAPATGEPEWLAEDAPAEPPAPKGRTLRTVPAAETEAAQS